MAVLNTEENLICEAAKSKNPALLSVFQSMLNFFTATSLIGKSYNDSEIIIYLYRRNHDGQSFGYIAKHIFHIGLSTLEDRRDKYIKIFNFYLKITKQENEAAFTTE